MNDELYKALSKWAKELAKGSDREEQISFALKHNYPSVAKKLLVAAELVRDATRELDEELMEAPQYMESMREMGRIVGEPVSIDWDAFLKNLKPYEVQ